MDARRLDDAVVSELLKAASGTSSGALSTPSGGWVDISGYQGDVVVIIDVGSVTGSGTLAVALEVGDDNTGANPVACVDARGVSLNFAGAGLKALVVNSDSQPKNFIGIASTLTGFTAAVVCALLLGRGGTPNV